MENWYASRYRRHLCDMHIDDWNEAFLSRFDPEEYVRNLKLAHVNMPMIYLQSHVGLCYYPTKTARMHKAFENEPDKMRRLIDLCHRNDMKVVGYYSLIFNRLAHDEHPAWRMVDARGESYSELTHSRHGLCCPNNPEYRAFVAAQIREMLEYFDVDAMFYDMPFWPHQCCCSYCRSLWSQSEGGEIPHDASDARFERLLAYRRQWMGEFAQFVTDTTKAIQTDIPVELNFANAIAGSAENAISDAVNEACDYTGGDLTGGLLSHAVTCRYYYATTKNQPFEYMTPRCPTLYKHTVSLTQRQLDAAVMLTAAHHGASLIIDAIDPIGTLDERVYQRIAHSFELQMPYESFFTGNPLTDIGVFFHLPSKVRRHGQPFAGFECAVEAVKTLAAAHIPTGAVTYRQLDNLNAFPVIMAPYLHTLSDAERNALVRYVQEGGKLYLSGAEDPTLIRELLGAEVTFTREKCGYLAPAEGRESLFAGFTQAYPLPYEDCLPMLSGLSSDAQVLSTITLPYTLQGTRDFASIHSNPPGIPTDLPGVVLRNVGRGQVLWCAAPIEHESIHIYGEVLLNLLTLLGLKPRMTSTASRIVELVPFVDGDRIRISAVRLNSDFEGDLPPFDIRIECPQPKEIVLLPDGKPVSFRYEEGCAVFTARALDLFDMYEIRN